MSRATAAEWAAKAMRGMTLREKIGQMLMVTLFGEFLVADNPAYKELVQQIEENRVGGFIIATAPGRTGLRRSQVYPTLILINDLQRRSKLPLLISADFENGTRMRLDEGTSFPAPMAIAATGDPKLAYAAGKAVAQESRAAGVHWIFAPDADVNNNPENPIINIRSFGEDPESVSRFVSEYVRGIEENGCLATAKHFPGHGNVNVDSHLALATVPGTRRELDAAELVPFRAAIAAGVSAIMPGHLFVPALDDTPSTPATLSHKILNGVLRNELKFRGLIVSDAMEMGGVTTLYAPGEAAVRAVEAGEDVLLQPPVPRAALEAIEAAVASKRISEKRIDESVLRILTAKARLGLSENRLVDTGRLNETFAQPGTAAQSLAIADRGVTLLRNNENLFPLNPAKTRKVLLVSLSGDPDACPGETIEPELRKEFASLTALRADTKYMPASLLRLPEAFSYDIAIVALFVRVADRKGSVALPPEQREFVEKLLGSGKPVVIVAFGSPYLIELFPNAKTWIAEFSTNEVAQRAVARALTGRIAISGKIPVTVPGVAKRDEGLNLRAEPMTLLPASTKLRDRLRPTFDAMEKSVADDAFPGGVLAVGWRDELAVRAFGKFGHSAKDAAVSADTIYDVASLTKPIVTATLAMMLFEQKTLLLDAQIARYLPEWGTGATTDPDPAWRDRMTVRMLLQHSAGLAAHREFFKVAKGRGAILNAIVSEPLVNEPGTKIEYSDLGFILLGEIIERLTGRQLDVLAQERIFDPLGMKDTFFSPPKHLRERIAPTENDVAFRKRLIRGEVHDENAWAMGGVSGHAGMFSTASDIAAFAQMTLNGGIYAHNRLVTRSTVELFTQRVEVGDSVRSLGWDVPVISSSAGRYISTVAYGHLGFTGTSLWIDPQKQIFVILLTNRVNPSRDNVKIRAVRPAVHDAIFEALGLV